MRENRVMAFPVAILWHMHQPHYGDPLRGVYSMPWARLHAIKGYYDMALLASRFPELQITFNLVPGLCEQVEELASGKAVDLHGRLSGKPATELTPDEKRTVLATFFLANTETMVKPYPRYAQLLAKRGTEDGDLDRALQGFSAADMRDLQTWGNLAWFGFEARRRFPEIEELRRKGRDFTEEDKARVLEIQRSILAELWGIYAEGARRGAFELTTTPFYHPILPLLIDSDSARRAMPNALLPRPFRSPESAEWHLREAVREHERLFGAPPRGLWPSEGSVSPEVIELAGKLGLSWVATDEGIRHHSRVEPSKASIYQPYSIETSSGIVHLFFRDRALSDRIGFTYSKSRPEDAFADFLGHARRVAAAEGTRAAALLPVILDGENAWEHYPDGGEGFLSRLYEALASGREIRGTTFSEHLASLPDPEPKILALHSGSWIDANFRIWIGHPEKNAAWEMLRQALEAFDHRKDAIGEEARGEAWRELMRAEGSDWFWWYGDDFSAATDEEFDRLFRSHVTAAYVALGADVPEALRRPLLLPSRPLDIEGPVALLDPEIDGSDSHYFEWAGAVRYDVTAHRSTMYRSERYLSHVYVGLGRNDLFLRLDGLPDAAGSRVSSMKAVLTIETDSGTHVATFPVAPAPGERFSVEVRRAGAEEPVLAGEGASDRVVEVRIPFTELRVTPGQRVLLLLSLFDGDLELDRYPRRNRFMVTVPGEDFEGSQWMV